MKLIWEISLLGDVFRIHILLGHCETSRKKPIWLFLFLFWSCCFCYFRPLQQSCLAGWHLLISAIELLYREQCWLYAQPTFCFCLLPKRILILSKYPPLLSELCALGEVGLICSIAGRPWLEWASGDNLNESLVSDWFKDDVLFVLAKKSWGKDCWGGSSRHWEKFLFCFYESYIRRDHASSASWHYPVLCFIWSFSFSISLRIKPA